MPRNLFIQSGTHTCCAHLWLGPCVNVRKLAAWVFATKCSAQTCQPEGRAQLTLSRSVCYQHLSLRVAGSSHEKFFAMSSIYDQVDTQATLLASSGEQHAAGEHQESERAASPPWSSWQDVSLQQNLSEMPDSPKSTGDWEVLNAENSSSHGSLSRFMHAENEDDLKASTADVPQLHITLTPQGSSAITLQLEAVGNHPSPRKPADAIQEQFQQQLRKAQETLLPDFGVHQAVASQGASHQPVEAAGDALPTSIHLSMQADTSDSNIDSPHDDAALSASAVSDENIVPLAHHVHTAEPASEHKVARQSSVGSDTQDIEQDKSAKQASFMTADEENSEEEAVGQASFMSDGSFVNVSANQEKNSTAGLAEALMTDVGTEAEAAVDEDLSESVQDIQAASLELSTETKEVLGLLDSATQELQASVHTDEGHAADPDTDIFAHDDQEVPLETMLEEEECHTSSRTSAAVASMRRRLNHVLSTLQAWGTSAYNCLPGFASSYSASTEQLKGKPAGWDWLHFLLTGSLTVVSAALGYYVVRERALARRLTGSNAELSKLLFKVINLQQSVQYTGRVPIIRHTSSVSALSTFPLTHLM